MATFSDDFNRPDSTNLGAGWVEVSGDWSIIGGQLAPDASSGNTILRAATPMASSDHSAQFTITATTAASQGVWCRGDATLSSGYLWRNNGSSWDLFAVTGGFTVIGTYAVAVQPGDVARVQAVGTTIKGFVNGVERVSVVNTAVTSGANVGLRVMALPGLRFDNFTASDVTAGVTVPLDRASAIETAQALPGAKTMSLGAASSTDAAQPFTGSKTTAPGAAVETADPHALAGAKTAQSGTAVETAAAQVLPGAKAAPLAPAIAVDAVQALAGAASRTLDTATGAETAWPLAGGKTATLSPAAETSTARPLIPAGPATDDDVDITVGVPYSPWRVGSPHASGWKVGAPC